MSLFNWFKRKPTAPLQQPPQPLASLRPEASAAPRPAGTAPEVSLRHRNERMERREQLYAVVRDAMVRAGVLSASYKFKVLALDQRGHQFLVMMDLAREHGSESARLSSIENVITQGARTRHAIAVTAVYWRINDQISSAAPVAGAALQAPPPTLAPLPAAAGAAPLPADNVAPTPASVSAPASVPASASAPVKASAPVPAPAAAAGMAQPHGTLQPGLAAAPSNRLVAPRFDPIVAEEVAAFRQALAGAHAGTPAAPPVLGVAVHSGARRTSFAESEFPDTQLPEEYEPRTRNSDLSNTQYGDL